jgi:hypothetical protein
MEHEASYAFDEETAIERIAFERTRNDLSAREKT